MNLPTFIKHREEELDRGNLENGFPPQPPWMHRLLTQSIKESYALALERAIELGAIHYVDQGMLADLKKELSSIREV